MQESVGSQVGEEAGPAEDLVGQVEPRLAAAHGRRRDRGEGLDRREVESGVEGGDAGDVLVDRGRRAGQRPHDATDVGQRRSGLQHRQAAGGEALVGPERGVRRDHPDPVEGEGQRVGGELGQRGGDALAELGLADPHLDDGGRSAPPATATQLPSRGLVMTWGGEVGHAVGSRAARTASTIRRCAPQRHRLPSSASATRAASAVGSSSSRVAARTTIPEMQKPHWAACRSRIALLHGVGRAVGGESLDGGDRAALGLPHRGLARGHDGAVEDHVAGTAQPLAAAEAGADQSEVVAQHRQQRGVRVPADLDARAVDLEAGHPKTSGWCESSMRVRRMWPPRKRSPSSASRRTTASRISRCSELTTHIRLRPPSATNARR